MGRLDEDGPRAIVQTREPVNKFPDFVAYLVRRLKVLCPAMGKVKIAQVLCRIGLHLGSTTVQRAIERQHRPKPNPVSSCFPRVVTAKRPNHVWHCDLSTVPTSLGFWVSWLPYALTQRRPFCWWIAIAIDHFSRRVMGIAVFEKQPSSMEIRAFLGRAARAAGTAPKYLISDHGKQFTDEGFARWCERHGIRQRFGAVGKYGSIAVVERFIRTLKTECTRQLLVPYRRDDFRRELTLYRDWYNEYRPHDLHGPVTPDEIYYGRKPAACRPRFEPRRHWPRGSPCAGPQAPIRGRRGQQLELNVRFLSGRRHLPIFELKRAA
jgi:transposase InsO family protein